MNKSKSLYVKALDRYNRGYVDKAIELCEGSINKDLKNTSAINLKGLLYYLKGDLDNAQRLWKMNFQVNKDSVAEKYLDDTKKDSERLKLYILALGFIKDIRIDEALSLLQKCSESDFNSININNYLAVCYIKKGEYNKAVVYIEHVLKVDKHNETAIQNKKTLEKLGVIKKEINFKRYLCISLIGVCIVSLVFTGLAMNKKFSFLGGKDGKKFLENIKEQIINKQENKRTKTSKNVGINSNNNTSNSEIASKEVLDEPFPSEKLNIDIQNKNFDELYDICLKWKDKNISINDKVNLSKAEELLKSQGVQYFYNLGCSLVNNKEYSNAKVYLSKAFNLGQGSYLYPHIIYMLGNSSQLSGDAESAIKYFTQYDKDFGNGDYEETVLYDLIIIYKDVDKNKSKEYAKKLANNFSSSIYNNSIVKEQLSN